MGLEAPARARRPRRRLLDGRERGCFGCVRVLDEETPGPARYRTTGRCVAMPQQAVASSNAHARRRRNISAGQASCRAARPPTRGSPPTDDVTDVRMERQRDRAGVKGAAAGSRVQSRPHGSTGCPALRPTNPPDPAALATRTAHQVSDEPPAGRPAVPCQPPRRRPASRLLLLLPSDGNLWHVAIWISGRPPAPTPRTNLQTRIIAASHVTCTRMCSG